MYRSNLNGSVCMEVKTYRYVCAGKTKATFELLMFEDGGIGTQGEIKSTGEGFSPGKVYNDVEIAVQEMIDLIEEKIKDDPWVQQTQKFEFK